METTELGTYQVLMKTSVPYLGLKAERRKEFAMSWLPVPTSLKASSDDCDLSVGPWPPLGLILLAVAFLWLIRHSLTHSFIHTASPPSARNSAGHWGDNDE